jgi:hypothetical protein
MPVEFETVTDVTGVPIDEVLVDAAAHFDAFVAPGQGWSSDRLAAERAKFLRELRDALLKCD